MRTVFYVLTLASIFSCNKPEKINNQHDLQENSSFYRSEVISHYDSTNKKVQLIISKMFREESLPDTSLLIQEFEQDKLIKESVYQIWLGDTTLSRSTQKKYKNNLLISEIRSMIGFSEIQNYYEYSGDKKIKDSLVYITFDTYFKKPKDTTISISYLKYDKNHNNDEVLEIKHSKSGEGSKTIDSILYVFQYDENDNKTKAITLHGKDTIAQYFTKYNTKNKLLSSLKINEIKDIGEVKYTYDSLGKEATLTLLRPDDTDLKTWYYYDNQDRLVRSITRKLN